MLQYQSTKINETTVLSRDECDWKDASDHRNACNLFDNKESDNSNVLLMPNIYLFLSFSKIAKFDTRQKFLNCKITELNTKD